MHWFWLALICALCLAAADTATKAWLQGYSALQLTLIRFPLTAALLSPALIVLPPLDTLPAPFWVTMAVMLPLELVAMLLYMRAIRDHPLTLTLPYLAFTPALTTLVAFALLGETLSLRGGLGIALVVVGAWVLNAEHAQWKDWRGWWRPLRAIGRQTGARLMLVVATIYALTATLGKVALAYVPALQLGALYFALIGGATLLVAALWPRARAAAMPRLWHRPGAVLLVAGLHAGMVLTHFLALREAEVAYMIAVKRSSLLFGMLFGVVLLREPGLRQRLPAGLLMLLGVALIAGA